jgi:DNA-binding NtrC family response regulator
MTHRPSARVLIVDPSGARPRVFGALRDEGVAVEVARHPGDALELITRSPPDVALIDLATADTREIVDALRSRDIDVIALAAPGDSAVIAQVRGQLAAVLVDPVAADAVVVAVQRSLELAALRRDAAALRTEVEGLQMAERRWRDVHREALSTLAHDVRASLAVVTMALPASGCGDSALERKLALTRRAVERACEVLGRALERAEVRSVDPADPPSVAGQVTTAAGR